MLPMFKANIPQGTIDSARPFIMSTFENNKRNFGGYTFVRNRVNDIFKQFHGTKPEDRSVCPHCEGFSPAVRFNHSNGTFSFPVPDERYIDGARGFDFNGAYNILKTYPMKMFTS